MRRTLAAGIPQGSSRSSARERTRDVSAATGTAHTKAAQQTARNAQISPHSGNPISTACYPEPMRKNTMRHFLSISPLFVALISTRAYADNSEQNFQSLETEVSHIESRVDSIETQIQSWVNHIDLSVPFIFATIAAIWAQNTRRNSVLWFLLGLILGPIAMIVLLFKNRKTRRGSQHAVESSLRSSESPEPKGNVPLSRQKVPDPLAAAPPSDPAQKD
ncbi:hypothetical protein OAF27_01165 [Verrucomicrobiales bacterium]|nr:hypothetical protein [Verrucomicrobiales bacterium]